MSRPEKLLAELVIHDLKAYQRALGYNDCHDAHTEWLKSPEVREEIVKIIKGRIKMFHFGTGDVSYGVDIEKCSDAVIERLTKGE